MEALAVLAIIAFIFRVIASANKTATTQSNQHGGHAGHTVKHSQTHTKQPAPKPSVHENRSDAGMAPAQPTEYRVMTHRLEATPTNVAYVGSMGGTTTEGNSLGNVYETEPMPTASAEPDSVYAEQIGGSQLLDCSKQGMLRAIVMSEVLTRPAQRKYGTHSRA